MAEAKKPQNLINSEGKLREETKKMAELEARGRELDCYSRTYDFAVLKFRISPV